MGCTFTQKQEDDFRQNIAAVDHKREGQQVIVSGCYLQAEPRGNIHYARKEDIPSLVEVLLAGKDFPGTIPSTPPAAPLPFVAISEGCYGNCTFCSIRLARGRHRSRPTAEILADVRSAYAAHGSVKLVGQEIAAYGRDTGSSLPALVRVIFAAIPDVRLELGTLGAAWMKDMSEEDLTVFADSRIHGNLHLPLQSASDSVLKAMRRGYTVEQFMTLLRTFRHHGITRFSTDLIAGFPGETARDHACNVSFLRSEAMAHAQIFAYDPRPGTPAAAMAQVPRPLRVERTLELIGVFLTHCDQFIRNEKANPNDFLNTNLEIGNEKVEINEG